MTRQQADLDLARRLNARLPFIAASIKLAISTPALLRHEEDMRDDLEDALRLLEEAAGRLMLRTEEQPVQ
jgi:hypothetical protein